LGQLRRTDAVLTCPPHALLSPPSAVIRFCSFLNFFESPQGFVSYLFGHLKKRSRINGDPLSSTAATFITTPSQPSSGHCNSSGFSFYQSVSKSNGIDRQRRIPTMDACPSLQLSCFPFTPRLMACPKVGNQPPVVDTSPATPPRGCLCFGETPRSPPDQIARGFPFCPRERVLDARSWILECL